MSIEQKQRQINMAQEQTFKFRWIGACGLIDENVVEVLTVFFGTKSIRVFKGVLF